MAIMIPNRKQAVEELVQAALGGSMLRSPKR